jgi:cellobiose-specific phosphotransferase system component IIA
MRILVLTVSLILLSACEMIGRGNDCVAWRPILVHGDDHLTTETARDILAHNLVGRRLCGW